MHPIKPFLKSNSRTYYVRIKQWHEAMQDFRWHNVCTRTTDRDTAKGIGNGLRIAAAAAMRLSGKQVDVSHMEAVTTSIYAAAGVIVDRRKEYPVIKEYAARFMEARRRRVVAVSFKTYSTIMTTFLGWVESMGGSKEPLDWFTPERAGDYYDDLLKTLATKTANERIKLISRMYKRAIQELGYPANPCAAIDMASGGERLERLPFTKEEVDRIIAFCGAGGRREREWGRAVMLSIMGTCRLEDAVTMPRSAIRGGVIDYTPIKTMRMNKRLVLPLVIPEWLDVLTRCRGRICPALAAEFERRGTYHLSSEFTPLVAAAGVGQEYRVFKNGRRVARKTFHSLRHTLQSFLIASGASGAQAEEIMGHSPGQGRIYTHTEVEEKRRLLTRALGANLDQAIHSDG